ncbi:uncharacterized protein LOC129906359 isoform X2 [Episyrphus balteatus]|uniref:uncharacterized protein LOC129906359 isoform X2 n=1 Tax=Episyrphus balteatus TaxID=286459 RepID=UPI0024854717|nr:uncharacterized protein LOC129906359 isoform X2 [Episyrphus balteatus]
MGESEAIQRLNFNDDDINVDEADESGYINGPIYDKIYKLAETFAATKIGHFVTGKVDGLLKLIEDTAKWSLPPRNQDKNESSVPLQRPLPWIPFIALILILRLARIGLSVAGLFIGNAPLVPSDVVYFIQTRRRKLRSIRIAGMREIQKNKQTQRPSTSGGLLSSVTHLMSMAICRPKLCEDTHNILVNENCFGEAQCSGVVETQQNHNTSKNRRIEDEDENISDHDLTLDQILDKYGASSNEDDDSDFIPPSDGLLDADTSATSTSSASSDEGINNDDDIENNESEAPPLSISNELNESNYLMTNGNISLESQDHSIGNKINGEHSDTKLRKPKIMPKPIKEEPLPLPIQEIKQEPADSDEDTNRNRIEFENSEDFRIPNKIDLHQHQHQQQSIVELENVSKESCENNVITENGKDQHMDIMNGDQTQSGSPDLCGNFGYQPTSILKNCQAVHLEKRGHMEAFAENENFIRGESTNESAATSRPAKNANHTGKPIKNKLRGKRR